jgi:hypothetical protein
VKPTIGRIVIYRFKKDEVGSITNRMHEVPAVIVRVWDSHCNAVNIRVLIGGEPVLYRTSIPEGTSDCYEGAGAWRWPVRSEL